MEFEVSTEKIRKHMVGRINSENLSGQEVMKKLKQANYQKVDLTCGPYDFCSLPNNTLLVADYENYKLHLYDESFNLIQTIDEIGNQSIRPYVLAINNRNQIYISSRPYHRVDMTDLKFNLIKSFKFTNQKENKIRFNLQL